MVRGGGSAAIVGSMLILMSMLPLLRSMRTAAEKNRRFATGYKVETKRRRILGVKGHESRKVLLSSDLDHSVRITCLRIFPGKQRGSLRVLEY